MFSFFDLLQLLIQPENQIRNINGCKMFDIKIYSNKEVINQNTNIRGGQALVLENSKQFLKFKNDFTLRTFLLKYTGCVR